MTIAEAAVRDTKRLFYNITYLVSISIREGRRISTLADVLRLGNVQLTRGPHVVVVTSDAGSVDQLRVSLDDG